MIVLIPSLKGWDGSIGDGCCLNRLGWVSRPVYWLTLVYAWVCKVGVWKVWCMSTNCLQGPSLGDGCPLSIIGACVWEMRDAYLTAHVRNHTWIGAKSFVTRVLWCNSICSLRSLVIRTDRTVITGVVILWTKDAHESKSYVRTQRLFYFRIAGGYIVLFFASLRNE